MISDASDISGRSETDIWNLITDQVSSQINHVVLLQPGLNPGLLKDQSVIFKLLLCSPEFLLRELAGRQILSPHGTFLNELPTLLKVMLCQNLPSLCQGILDLEASFSLPQILSTNFRTNQVRLLRTRNSRKTRVSSHISTFPEQLKAFFNVLLLQTRLGLLLSAFPDGFALMELIIMYQVFERGSWSKADFDEFPFTNMRNRDLYGTVSTSVSALSSERNDHS